MPLGITILRGEGVDKKRFFTISLMAWLVIVLAVSCGNSEPVAKGRLVTETYTVVTGDTLDVISYQFIKKSSVRRDVREFREGIIQLNWEEVFKNRYPHGLIRPGDKLKINYWVEEK
ncbi:hypothetical protein SPTER_15190 [Sporomusa termitida]|uniref:LysM domain-containing protein n=1 Tax=Sporomusa termitida TaxID=2377 RepID=A0A517DS67_9FIRM|nr:hypothetical protein SPTER_15190 [Sporomusa termitida]